MKDGQLDLIMRMGFNYQSEGKQLESEAREESLIKKGTQLRTGGSIKKEA